MPRHPKGSDAAKEYMKKLREMRGKKKMSGGMNGSEEKEEVKQEEIKKLPKDVIKKIISLANEMKLADNEIKKMKRLLGRTLQDIQSEGGFESVLNELISDTATTRRFLDRLRNEETLNPFIRILGRGVKHMEVTTKPDMKEAPHKFGGAGVAELKKVVAKAKAEGKIKKRPPTTTMPIDIKPDVDDVTPLPMPLRGRGVTKEQYDAVKKIMEVQASPPMSGIVQPMK
jgi:hypothetical protein